MDQNLSLATNQVGDHRPVDDYNNRFQVQLSSGKCKCFAAPESAACEEEKRSIHPEILPYAGVI